METLDEKWKSMVAIACFEAKGETDKLAVAINEGLDNGLTVSQVKESLSQLYAYTGFPRSLNALGTLQNVMKQRDEQGRKYEQGQDASPLPINFDALKRGTEVQTQLSNKAFNYTFAPATDYYLKAHLFGDIFARDNLTFAQRELVTIAALSGIKGVDPQLRSHVSGARNMGLGDSAIKDIPNVLRAKVGDVEAFRVNKAIAAVYDEPLTQQPPFEPSAFPKGVPNTAYAQYFIGNSYLAPLLDGGQLPIHNVTFEPGCRNNWHIHHKGEQILICINGRGWYQEWGKPAQALKPGDVVNVPAETKHWHGAARDSWFQHIAIAVPVEGASNEWCEPVTDEECNKLEE